MVAECASRAWVGVKTSLVSQKDFGHMCPLREMSLADHGAGVKTSLIRDIANAHMWLLRVLCILQHGACVLSKLETLTKHICGC